jgi:hypothetical protein
MLEKIFNAPEEVRDAAVQSLLIPRYTRTYKEGLFRDSTGAHTIRCIDKADKLPLKNRDKNIVKGILWGHDLPEIITSDYTVIQKGENINLAKKLESEEFEAARLILPAEFQKHIFDFNNADKFINDKDYEYLPSPHALVAKTIDNVDGDIFFHKHLTRWMSSSLYNPKDVPPTSSLIYSFDCYRKYCNRLISFPNTFQPFNKIVYDLQYLKVLKIISYWWEIEKDKTPRIIKKELSNIYKELLI